MIRSRIDLGRFRLGQTVALFLAVVDADGSPAVPPGPAVATIYDDAEAPVATVTLGPADLSGAPYLLTGSFPLGTGQSLGKFLVVYRYRAGDDAGLATATFAVVGGGDAGGSVIALHALDRPEARYVLGQLSGGSLVQGRNPHF